MPSPSRTLVCSVLFLDIAGYTKRPVGEQMQVKQAFNETLADALAPVAPRDRIILDTGDGAAIAFLGDPQEALLVSVSMRDSPSAVPLRQGINLGPVQFIKDLNGRVNIIGDGINAAQRVMDFAEPGQIFVSRPFFEVTSCLSGEYEGLFRREGSRADKHVREHELYSVVGGAAAAGRLAATASHLRPNRPVRRWLAAPGPWGLHRGALVAAPLVFLLAVGSGLAVRTAGKARAAAARPPVSAAEPRSTLPPQAEPRPAPKAPAHRTLPDPAPAPKGAATQKAKPAANLKKSETAPTAARRNVQQAGTKDAAAKARPAAVPRGAIAQAGTARPLPAGTAAGSPPPTGTIALGVAPWGEILIDGKRRGYSPPLRSVEVTAGLHVLEIRNSSFPQRVEQLNVQAGEQVTIRHRFN